MKKTNLIFLYEEIINELQGVSHEVRQWASHILDRIKDVKEDGDIVIYGDEDEELYHVFPVDHFVITIKKNLRAGGMYDESSSGYKDGKYNVYITVAPNPDLYVLNHELRHAYEDYKRLSKGSTPLSKTKEVANLFGGNFEQLMTGELRGNYGIFPSVIRALYYTSKVEESAYGETIYDKVDDVFRNLRDILRIDYKKEGNYNPARVSVWWNEFKKDVNIPILNKFNDYQNFLDWADKTIKERGNKAMKKFLKIKYLRNKV